MKSFVLFAIIIMFSNEGFAQRVGANFNENIENINPQLLEKSETKWIRLFVNIPRLLLEIDNNGKITGINQQGFENFDYSALTNLEGYKIILSLKLDFKYKNIGVPNDNSKEEACLISAVSQFLKGNNLGDKIDILVVGNEPMWETPIEDAKQLGSITNKIISQANILRIEQQWNYQIFTGALNRISELKEKNEVANEILKITRENPLVDGLDLHIHAKDLSQANDDPAYIINYAKINKQLICTEFSLVRLFEEYIDNSLGDWGTKNGYPSNMKLYEWLNLLQEKALDGTPINQEVFISYFNSQSWYPKQWFNTFLNAFNKNNISIATYGIANNRSLVLNSKSALWLLNFVYNKGVFGNDNSGVGNTNPLVYPEFRVAKK